MLDDGSDFWIWAKREMQCCFFFFFNFFLFLLFLCMKIATSPTPTGLSCKTLCFKTDCAGQRKDSPSLTVCLWPSHDPTKSRLALKRISQVTLNRKALCSCPNHSQYRMVPLLSWELQLVQNREISHMPQWKKKKRDPFAGTLEDVYTDLSNSLAKVKRYCWWDSSWNSENWDWMNKCVYVGVGWVSGGVGR